MRWIRTERPVEVYPSFVLLVCLLIFLDTGMTVLFFLLSAALHEGGHLAAMRMLRVPFYKLELRGTGAVIHTGAASSGREAVCTAAGPMVNLLAFLLTFRLLPAMALVNLLLLCWNLLPLSSFDGGRLLHLALIALFSQPAADRISCVLDHLLAFTVSAYAVFQTCIIHAGLYPCLFAAVFLCKAANTPCKIGCRRLKWKQKKEAEVCHD